MSEAYVNVGDQDFDKNVLQAKLPSIVDFWAPWCMPCRAMAPTFEELANEYQGKMQFAKVNTDDNPFTPGKFGIQGIPTLIFFNNGKEIHRIVGRVQKPELKKQIDSILATAV